MKKKKSIKYLPTRRIQITTVENFAATIHITPVIHPYIYSAELLWNCQVKSKISFTSICLFHGVDKVKRKSEIKFPKITNTFYFNNFIFFTFIFISINNVHISIRQLISREVYPLQQREKLPFFSFLELLYTGLINFFFLLKKKIQYVFQCW